jgi:alanine racemase
MEPAEGMDFMDGSQPLEVPHARISQAALLHNMGLLRRSLRPGVKLCAILKANAYGHDAELVARALVAGDGTSSVDAIGVANIDEAASLPAVPVPVIIFRPVENTYLGQERRRIEWAIRAGWTLTICSAAAVGDVGRIAIAMDRRARIQVMIDTGMTRMDASPGDLGAILEAVDAQPSVQLTGLCTHFASSEKVDDSFNAEQLRRFTRSIAVLPRKRKLPVLHAANSAAVFFHPDAHLDMVRPGLSLYGIDPTLRPSMNRTLRPVMKWVAPILMVKSVARGTSVGYNQTWIAERDSRIGLVPVGYADGYQRCFSNCARMMVHGRAAPVVGRVSMDVTAIDLTDLPQVRGGDEVIVLDSDPLSPASVYQLANLAQTIPYEIFCRVGQRVRRVLVDAVEGAHAAEAVDEHD